jgi:hypothetical protein
VGTPKTHIKSNETLPNDHSATDDRLTRRRKRGKESSQDRTRNKPTSNRVATRESNYTANVPVGCHGIMEGKGGNNVTRSTPYKTAKLVASNVQTVMFSDTKRENSFKIPEYYQNQPKQQSRDSGGGSATIKTKNSQEKDETRKKLAVDATSV